MRFVALGLDNGGKNINQSCKIELVLQITTIGKYENNLSNVVNSSCVKTSNKTKIYFHEFKWINLSYQPMQAVHRKTDNRLKYDSDLVATIPNVGNICLF